jgi:prophage regulatory protein
MTTLLGFSDLAGKGIPYSRQHIHKLVRKGLFPRPIKLGVGHSRNQWPESEIDQYKENCIARRDAATLK